MSFTSHYSYAVENLKQLCFWYLRTKQWSFSYYYILHSGIKTGRSILIEDGALPWIVQNANNEAAPIRRHIELALCHLAQHGNMTSYHVFQFFSHHYKTLNN